MQSVYMHFKPDERTNPACLFMLFLVDFIMSILFQTAHVYFFVFGKFKEDNNHILHIIIGAGFTGIVLFYAFIDGIRFLRSNVDKVLYLISCLLQKPILLPMILPGRFRSRIAQKHLDTHTIHMQDKLMVEGKIITVDKKVQPTNFLLAVQETNFLYSFTLSGFVSFTTACTMLIENNFSDDENGQLTKLMLIISLCYTFYGVTISVYMYGRKTDHLFRE